MSLGRGVLEGGVVNRSTSEAELGRLLAVIEQSARETIGVNEYEGLLIQLLALLESHDLDHHAAAEQLIRLTEEWPWGAVESLEFTMRRLRWPEVREALLAHHQRGLDFRTRDLAAQVLDAYEDDWPTGEIYETYRRSHE